MNPKGYGYVFLSAVLITLSSCFSMVGEDVTIAKKILKDGSLIQLDYRGGGATAPDVVWVSKTNSRNRILIGKYKGSENGYAIEISQINDSIVIKLTDTLRLRGAIIAYQLSLKDTIYYNDGSSYVFPRKISN